MQVIVVGAGVAGLTAAGVARRAGVDDMRRLAEPVSGRLVLAGEATVPEPYGTVHAAFASGLRAARHVVGDP